MALVPRLHSLTKQNGCVGPRGGSSLKVAAPGVSGVCDGVSCLKVALPLLWSVFEVRDGDRMEHVGRGAARA